MHCSLTLKNFVPHEHGNCYILNFEKKSYLFKLGLINVVQSAIGNIISISTATKFTDLTLSQVSYDTLIKAILTELVLLLEITLNPD